MPINDLTLQPAIARPFLAPEIVTGWLRPEHPLLRKRVSIFRNIHYHFGISEALPVTYRALFTCC